MTRVDFLSYAAPPDTPGKPRAHIGAPEYELQLTPLGIEARGGGACCVYPFGSVRQWWVES